jgi:hypothetical protein
VRLTVQARGAWCCRAFSYSIVYLDEPDFVLVVAVAHHRREPGYWSDRL